MPKAKIKKEEKSKKVVEALSKYKIIIVVRVQARDEFEATRMASHKCSRLSKSWGVLDAHVANIEEI